MDKQYSLIMSGPPATLSTQDFAVDKYVTSIFPNPNELN
jgi:hypothetical protein